MVCHFNFQRSNYDPQVHAQTLDYLSNLTPHSILYNETVLRLRRVRRDIDQQSSLGSNVTANVNANASLNVTLNDEQSINGNATSISQQRLTVQPQKQLNSFTQSADVELPHNLVRKLDRQTTSKDKISIPLNTNEKKHVDNIIGGGGAAGGNGIGSNENRSQGKHVSDDTQTSDHTVPQHFYTNSKSSYGSNHGNKINAAKQHWNILKNKIRQKIKFIDSHNQPPLLPSLSVTAKLSSDGINNAASVTPDCQRLSNYAWLFIVVYILFSLCLFTFLVLSESTVFTMTVVTAALPLIGIFWSLFELKASGNSGKFYRSFFY